MKALTPAVTLSIAVAVNTGSVAAEGWGELLSRGVGRCAPLLHVGLVVPAWGLFLRSIRCVPPNPRRRRPIGRLLGGGCQIAGLVLVVLGFRRLGLGALVNADVFGLAERRPLPPLWGMVRDPIYLGYSALLAGWALRAGRRSLLPIAAQMLILLKAQARIEDWAACRR